MTFLPEADVSVLGELELEGITEPDDLAHVPDKDIEDYMVSISSNADDAGGLVARGFKLNFGGGKGGGGGGGGGRKSLNLKGYKQWKGNAEARTMIARPARIFGGKSKGPESGPVRYAELRNPRSNRNREKQARPEAVEAAKKSSAAQNILKDKTFQECLLIGAGTALGHGLTKRESSDRLEMIDEESQLKVVIDLQAPPSENHPSPVEDERMIMMFYNEDTKSTGNQDTRAARFTYLDNYDRYDRIPYAACGNIYDKDNDRITWLETWNGCCRYYGEHDCHMGLFSQSDREDGKLKGDHNDAISSYWCTFDLNCAGAPP